MFCLFRSLATAILDYHIFYLCQQLFIFFEIFLFYFHSLFRFHISDAFCCFPVTLLSAFILTFPTALVNCFYFQHFNFIPSSLVNFFHHVIYLLILYGKRRKRDLNPRTAINDLLPFQGSPFSHLGISPKRLSFFWHKKTTDD